MDTVVRSVQLDLFNQPLPETIEQLFFAQAMELFVYVHWRHVKMYATTQFFLENLNNYFHGRLIDRIGRQDVVNLRKWLKDKFNYGLSAINKHHMILKLLFNKLDEWKMDEWVNGINFKNVILPSRNPADQVTKPRDPARMRFIAPGEYRTLLKISKRVNDWDMVDNIRMGIWTRMSPIDLEHLNDEEIDEARMEIVYYRRHTITPKNPQGVLHAVKITEKMWGLINRRRQTRAPGNTRILNFTNKRRRINKIRKIALAEGMKDFTQNDFRKAGPAHLYEKGQIDSGRAADLLGNNEKTAVRHYLPRIRPHVREDSRKIQEVFD